MRRLYSIVLVLIALTAQAQSPDKMSYQAVVRNAENELVASEKVGMQISVLQGTTSIYVETQTPTSNANGLVSLEIGGGTVVSGDFSTIDWSSGTFFLKTEIDPTGGTDYTISGISQLLSVPFALYAKTAGNSSGSSFDGKFTSLTDVPEGLSDGDADTQLTESQVDAFVANNGYLSAEVDGSVTNETNTSVVLDGTDLKVTDSGGTITTDLSSLATIALERELFKTSGTFTVPNDVNSIRVTLIGGGGSGGSRGPGGEFGAGGESGNYVKNQIVAVTPGETLTVTVGAGGAVATCSIPWTNGCPGNQGGTSSVGALVSATGGAGGCGSCLSGSDDKSGKTGPFGMFGSGSDGIDVFEVNSDVGNSGMVLIEYYFW